MESLPFISRSQDVVHDCPFHSTFVVLEYILKDLSQGSLIKLQDILWYQGQCIGEPFLPILRDLVCSDEVIISHIFLESVQTGSDF